MEIKSPTKFGAHWFILTGWPMASWVLSASAKITDVCCSTQHLGGLWVSGLGLSCQCYRHCTTDWAISVTECCDKKINEGKDVYPELHADHSFVVASLTG